MQRFGLTLLSGTQESHEDKVDKPSILIGWDVLTTIS
jgi:hypothetical protein